MSFGSNDDWITYDFFTDKWNNTFDGNAKFIFYTKSLETTFIITVLY